MDTNGLYKKFGIVIIALLLIVFIRSRLKGGAKKADVGSVGTGKIKPNGKSCSKAPNSRGLRNNNPGNIRIGTSAWMGKIPVSQNTDGSFEQFETWVYGLRAMIKLIRNYIYGGQNSIAKIISKYAPVFDNNDTNAYINLVVKRSGILANKQLDADNKTDLRKIIKAMVEQELGCNLVTDAEFNKAWDLL